MQAKPVQFARIRRCFAGACAAAASATENSPIGYGNDIVLENNAGQMIDDVRLAVLGRAPVEFIGGLTLDSSGFGIGPDIQVPIIRERILHAISVVGIQVDIEHSIDALLEETEDGENRIVEITETARPVGAAVVRAAGRVK